MSETSMRGGYAKRSKAAPPAKARAEVLSPPASPPVCPAALAPTTDSPPRACRWTRPPPPRAAPAPTLAAKAAAKGKAVVPAMRGPSGSVGGMRRPRFSYGTAEERNALLNRLYWKCFRCDFDKYGERQKCNKCFFAALGHVLFDPETQHINPITCFYTLGPAPEAATSDTPGAASSGANDAAVVPTPTSAAAATEGTAEGGEPGAKRNRTAPPVAAGVDMHAFMRNIDATVGGLQTALLAAIDRSAGAAPATASMQPENVAWLSAAPPAYQGVASSMLASYAAATRARAGMQNRGAPLPLTSGTPEGAGSPVITMLSHGTGDTSLLQSLRQHGTAISRTPAV